MMLYEQCSNVGDGASEKQTIMTMLVTMTKHWNSVRSLITKRYNLQGADYSEIDESSDHDAL